MCLNDSDITVLSDCRLAVACSCSPLSELDERVKLLSQADVSQSYVTDSVKSLRGFVGELWSDVSDAF